ncbi:MAG: hypothetical protein Q8O56_12510 [Solirubrobacteraceae bacterium]|nr:hypothetical protein [Solirubrobacteraceae bacterium]
MLKKVLLRAGTVVVGLCVVAGGAYAVKTLLDGDGETEAVSSAPLRVTALAPGTFAAAHPFAPYYVVPRTRFASPSDLTRAARNNLLTKPASALTKGAMAGSPQIVRLSLRATSDDPVTVEAVRFKVVSDAAPLRGWYTALRNCAVEPVRRARLSLDSERGGVRYLGPDDAASETLGLKVERGAPQILELQAATSEHRVAWTAELSLRDEDGNASSVVVDDDGDPFRVTSRSDAEVYRPIYGASGIIGYSRARTVADCE